MLKRTLKMAWFKKNRYALTVVAIALSVAFIVSTLLLTTSISNVGDPLSEAYGEVDAVVSGSVVTEADGPLGSSTALVPATVVEDLQNAGYEAVGFNQPYAQVLDSDGNPVGQEQASGNVAEPWLGDSGLNGFSIIDGEAPSGPSQLAMDVTTAAQAGVTIGDTVSYVTDDGLATAELVGIAGFGGADNDPYTATVLLDAADPLFAVGAAGPGAGFEYVLVNGPAVTEGSASDGLADGVVDAVAALAPGQTVTDGATWVADLEAELNSFLGFFETFLTIFAVIAVVVGMVIVTNTFSVSLAQRTQELALLRLVGTTRRQLMSQVTIEALMLGLAGTIIGLIVGLLGVDGLGWFLDRLGLTIERSGDTSVVALSVGALVGIVVTVAAAVWPARKATEVAPIEALRSAEVEPPSAGRNRILATGAAVVLAIVTGAIGVIQSNATVTGVAIFALFLALYLGGEFLIRGAARLARPLLGAAGPTGTVASRNLERNAGRTSAAASALMIGVSLIGFFTLMVATIGSFIAGDADDGINADYVVQGIGSFPEPAIPDDAIIAMAEVDGVSLVVPVDQVVVAAADRPVVEATGPGPQGSIAVGITSIDDLSVAYDFVVTDGSLDDVAGTAVLVDEDLATSYALAVGSPFDMMSSTGPVTVEVAAIVENSLPGVLPLQVVGAVDLGAAFGIDEPATTAFILGDDVSEAELRAAAALPTLNVATTDEYIDGLSSNLDTVLALVYALLAVAVVIALVGIANTVSLAISERVGEIAAMRAAGASMRQIFWSLIAEFGLLSFVGVAAGLGLAWLSAAGLFQTLSNGEISTPETSLVTGLFITVLALAGGVLAAWLPARSAANGDILDVLRAE